MQSKWNGMYNYKSWCIWCPGDDGEWICEPINWNITAIENYKNSDQFEYHKTIVKAKKWVRDFGIELKEENFIT